MKPNELYHIIYSYKELKKIANSLSNLDTQDCNVGLTPVQEKRETKLITKAETLAQNIGLHAYHQSDPRGCSLYLVENDPKDARSNYTNGFAVC